MGIPRRGLSCTNIIYNPQGGEEKTMNQETINKAVKVINRHIRFYQRRLTYQLEMKVEAKLNNGNLKVAKFDDYESNIKKYEIILSDLATIKRAIKNKKTMVKIIETAQGRGIIYDETSKAIKEAGFDYNVDVFKREIYLCSLEERKEAEERIAMQLNKLMAEFEE